MKRFGAKEDIAYRGGCSTNRSIGQAARSTPYRFLAFASISPRASSLPSGTVGQRYCVAWAAGRFAGEWRKSFRPTCCSCSDQPRTVDLDSGLKTPFVGSWVCWNLYVLLTRWVRAWNALL